MSKPTAAPVSTGPAAVTLFHSLSDRTRLAIVRRLGEREARVADLVGELGLARSTVSAHMACLRDCGLVTGRSQGRQVFYALARPELLDLLAAAETLLGATGNAVTWCLTYGRPGHHPGHHPGPDPRLDRRGERSVDADADAETAGQGSDPRRTRR